MDRLYLVALLVLWIPGCDDGSGADESATSGRGRVNAVQAQKEEVPGPSEFCDRYREPGKAGRFEFPKLRGTPPEAPEGWRWVNVWATWCKPCIEELPRLVEWQQKLREQGLADLVLISVDEKRKTVDAFREEHPETPESLLVEKPDAIKPWVKSLGLSANAPLPIHVFVGPQNRVRCLRAGGVGPDEYAAVERLLGT